MGELGTFIESEFKTKTPLQKASSGKEIVNVFLRQNPQVIDSVRSMDQEQRQQFVDDVLKKTRERYPEAFTVEIRPKQKKVRETPSMERNLSRQASGILQRPSRKIVEEIPAVTRPLFDRNTELALEMINGGDLQASDLDLEMQEGLLPFVRSALSKEKADAFAKPLKEDLASRDIGPNSFAIEQGRRSALPSIVVNPLRKHLAVPVEKFIFGKDKIETREEDFKRWQLVYPENSGVAKTVGTLAGLVGGGGATTKIAGKLFEKAAPRIAASLVGQGLVDAAFFEDLPGFTPELLDIENPSAKAVLTGAEGLFFAGLFGLGSAGLKRLRGKPWKEVFGELENMGVKDPKGKLKTEMQRIAQGQPKNEDLIKEVGEAGKALIKEGLADPETISKTVIPPAPKGQKVRKTIQSQVEKDLLDPKVLDEIVKTGEHVHTPISNNATKAEVAAALQKDGPEVSTQRVFDKHSDLAPRQKMLMLDSLFNEKQRQFREFEAAGDADSARRVLDESNALEREMLRSATELGQGVQILRNIGLNLVPETWVRKYQKVLEEFAQRNPKQAAKFKFDPKFSDKIREMVRKAAQKPEGFQRIEAFQDISNLIAKQVPPNGGDTLQGMLYANALGGIQTQVLNIGSGFTNLALNTLLLPQSVGEFLGNATGMLRGIGKGTVEAANILRTGKVVRGRSIFGEGLGTEGRVNPLELNPVKGPASVINNWKFIGRFLSAGDSIITRGGEEAFARSMAYRMATDKGLKGRARAREVGRILGNNKDNVVAAKKQAAQEGLKGINKRRRINEIVEQSRPENFEHDSLEFGLRSSYNQIPEGIAGNLARSINSFSRQHPWAKLAVPFTRVVANVTNAAVDYLPTSYKRNYSGSFLSDIGKDKIQLLQRRKAIAGTLGMTALALWASRPREDGLPRVTGNLTGDPKVRFALEQEGIKPHSILVGNRYISYRETPLSIAFALVGNYFDGIRYGKLDEEDAASRMGFVLSNTPQVIFQQSFLTGLADTFEFLNRDKPRLPQKNILPKVISKGVKLGTPGVLRDISRIFDPTVYTNDTITEALTRNFPVVKSLGSKPILNNRGEPIRKNYTLLERILPRFVSVIKEDPLGKVLHKNKIWLAPPRNPKIIDGGEEREMTPEERYEFTKNRQQFIVKILNASLSELENMEPEAARKFVKEVSRKSTIISKAQLMQNLAEQ